VNPSSAPKSKYITAIVSVLVISVITAIVSVLVFSRPSESVENNLPPASELSFRSQAIKNLLVPISGEDALNDKNSPQYLAFEIVAELDPEGVLIPLNNTERIIQRYSVLTVILSILTVDFAKTLEVDKILEHECIHGNCNEFGQIDYFQLANTAVVFPWVKRIKLGTIPKEVGQLTNMTHIIINDNSLHRTIPTELGMLKNLQFLDLRNNKLSGVIPTELGRLPNLLWTYMDRNSLNGSIPSEIGNMDKLLFMNVSYNDLTGSIPSEVGKLENLNGFDISSNGVIGDVDFLCKNNFTGEVFKHKQQNGGGFEKNYADKFGLVIDCPDETDSMLQCSCCDCVF